MLGRLCAVSWSVLMRAACFASRLVRTFCQLKFMREEHSSRDAFVCVSRGAFVREFFVGARAWLVHPVSGVARRVHWRLGGRMWSRR